MENSPEEEIRIMKLKNNDILIGKAVLIENDQLLINNPYTVKDLGQGPCVMPYELDILVEPMKYISFDKDQILWVHFLKDFTAVQDQYIQATSGLILNS